jgi:hypothetical protein
MAENDTSWLREDPPSLKLPPSLIAMLDKSARQAIHGGKGHDRPLSLKQMSISTRAGQLKYSAGYGLDMRFQGRF